MAQYDGSIRINTNIDISGIAKGYKEMSESMKDVAQGLNDIVSGANKSTDAITKSAKKETESVEELDKSLSDVSEGIDSINGKKIDIKVERYDNVPIPKNIEEPETVRIPAESFKYDQEAIKFVEEYAAKSEEAIKKKKTTLLSLIAEAKNGLKELSEQGFGPGDQEYDYAAQKLTEYNRELQAYTKGIAESVQKEIYGLDSIEGKIADVNQKIAELSQMGFGIESSEMQEQVKLRAELLETEKKIYAEVSKTDAQRQAEAEKQEAAQRKIEEQKERALQKENEREQKRIENEAKLAAKEAERQARELAAAQAQEQEEQKLSAIRENAVVGNHKIVQSAERIKELEQEIADLKKAGVTEGYKDYDDRINELSRLKQELRDYGSGVDKVKKNYKKLGEVAKKSFEKANKSTKKTSGFLGTMASRFKSLALSLLIFNQISKAFNAMMSGIKEGMQNLAQYSGDTNKALSLLMSSTTRLKNALATAFSPIAEVVAPALARFIDLLSEAATKASEFFAALTGKDTFTRAVKVQQDYADSLKNTSKETKKAAKETEKALAPFDDLRQIQFQQQDEKEENKSNELAPEQMFETAKVSEDVKGLADTFKSAIDAMKEKAKELKDVFMPGFWDGLGNYKPRLEELKSDLAKIGGYLKDIFTDADVMAAASWFVNSFVYMVGTYVGALASVGLTIATNIVGGIESYLSNNTERIKEWLVRMFDIGTEINEILSDFFIAFADVFSVFASQTAQDITGYIIQIFADIFGGVLELTWKFTRDMLNIILTPFVENKDKIKNAITQTLEPIKAVVQSIAETVRKAVDKIVALYDEHIHPFFESIKDGLSELQGKLLDAYSTHIVPILNRLAEKFKEVMEGPVGEAIDSAVEFIGKLVDALKMLWEKVLVPFFGWIVDNIIPVIAPIIEMLGEHVLNFVTLAAGLIKDLFDALSGLIDFIVGVFTGDWDRAWGGVKKIFESIWNSLSRIADFVLKSIGDTISKLLDSVKEAAKAIGDLFKKKESVGVSVEAVPEAGRSFSFNRSKSIYSDIPFPTLPYKPPALATGTVVPPNREFMAVLGDNKKEPEIVAPESTIKRMVQEAMREEGIAGGGRSNNSERPIYLQLDGKTFARLIAPYAEEEKTRIGVRMVTQGA